MVRRATYHSDIPTWISHHFSLVRYLEHIKIPPDKSVYRSPPPKNIEQNIYKYVDRKIKDTFFTTNLL
jgi:hypothetical protein